MRRRSFLQAGASAPMLAAVGSGAILGALGTPGLASAGDYRAVVCVFMTGGNDGHNVLVPTDGAYLDYAASRYDLALPLSSLTALTGASAGHTFGLNPAAASLASLYNQQRLAFVANAGPLVQPTTAEQALNGSATLPPFLLSHSDQIATQQGWMGDEDASGWAGRSIEMLPSALNNKLSAVTMDSQRTLVLGRSSSVSFLDGNGSRYWGSADLADPSSYWSQAINRMAQWQFANEYEAEYSRTFGGAVADATLITEAFSSAQAPLAEFDSNYLAFNLRALASLLPVFKARGYRRQVFLVNYGSFDTHTGQRGSGELTQDAQLANVARAMAAFDQANQASGLNDDVVTLALSDFGRTLKPASGGGSDHAWGNNWWVMGGPVAGGQVVGELPPLVLGGINDWDRAGEGRFVPTTSTDQVAATLMQWLGLPASSVLQAFPNLANFSQHNLGFLAT